MTGNERNIGLPDELADRDFEQLLLCRDPVGLESVIAVHDTTLGLALGGVRMRRYPSRDAAVADALNLAEAMTYKAALAGLELGGGKSVINADPTVANRDELLVAHAQYIATLGGRYIPGVDMGTTVRDLELIARWAPIVCSQRGDPSAFTARGVVRSIEAALPHAGHEGGLAGRRAAVQGVGSVGLHVARMLAEAGADVLVADVDPDKVAHAADQAGAQPMRPEDILLAEADVVCPCAGGGVVDERVAGALQARVLAGAANNVLVHRGIAATLAARGVVHVPDFVSNAGGLMAVDAELRDDDSELAEKVEAIGETADAVLTRAGTSGRDVVSVALELARERLEARRSTRPQFHLLANAR